MKGGQKMVQEKLKPATKDKERDLGIPMQCTAIDETEMVKGFHLDP
jgi:hypothetical protein